MSRTARLALNTASNAARLVVATGVWIVLTPVMLRGLGVAEYGTWQLAGSVLGLFQLLDAGFGVGVIRAVGHAAGDQDTDRRNRMLSTYLVAYLVMGLIAAVGLGLFGLFFPRLFSLPAALGGRAQLVLWLLGLRVVVLALPLSLYRGVLIGEQRLGLVNLIQTISQIAYGALFVLALQRDAGIVALAAISLATMLAEHAVYAVLAFRLTPGLRVSPALAHFSLLRQTMSLSAAQLLIALSGLILLRTDPLIVQLFVGLSGVAAYTIALRVAEQAFLGIKQFVNALSPVVAQLHGTGDEGMQRVILLSGTKLAMVPAALLGGLTIALGRPALELWVGPDVATIAPVMTVLVLAMMLTVPQEIVFNLFTYTDRHALPGRAAVAGALVNLGATIALAPKLGLLGIALGTLTATLVVDVFWVLGAACRAYSVRYVDYIRAALLPPLALTVPLVAVTSMLVHLRPPASLLAVAAYALPGVALFLGLFWVVGLTDDERRRIHPRTLFGARTSAPGRAVAELAS